jgi:4,5-dihydroxyphthalate decarboxylase
MADLELSIALERYDRHVPIFMGAVPPPPGIALRALEVGMQTSHRDGRDRHRRFLQGREFDIAETSLSSHIISVARGEPFVGIPVFPRRLFSQNHILVRAASGIEGPKDLEGKRVVINAFQVTMTVLALGDLKFEYGVDLKKIHWLSTYDEVLDIGARDGFSVGRVAAGADPGQLLLSGDADAIIFPHPPASVLGTDQVRPLFPDRKAEALRYFDKLGYYPIMHLIAFQAPVIDANPELAAGIAAMWDAAKAEADHFYEDPGYANLAFARNEFEDQQGRMRPNAWPFGLAANRANLERFISYMADQGLIEAPLEVERLFHPSSLDS